MMSYDHATQLTQPALQAASGAIGDSRFIAGGRTDGLSGSENAQNWLLDASRGIFSVSLPVQSAHIHNTRLSMALQRNSTLPCSCWVLPLVRIRWTHTSQTLCSLFCDAAARRSRRAASKPRVFKYIVVEFQEVQHG